MYKNQGKVSVEKKYITCVSIFYMLLLTFSDFQRSFPCQSFRLFFGVQQDRQENKSSVKSLFACD